MKRVALLAVILLAGRAARDPKFTSTAPADFWFSLWHGVICFVTLVVGIFKDNVKV